MSEDAAAFVRANTALAAPPLVPEIEIHQAAEFVPIWEATEKTLAESGREPPYWAFAWAGGQALARYVLDRSETVAGKRVLDFAAGSGLAGIAAAKAGAGQVTASEIDPFAAAAIALNAELNGVDIEIVHGDLVGAARDWDVVLAGDVCYEKPMAERVTVWLRQLAGAGAEVLLGDPIRGFLPTEGLERLARYAVETRRPIEDADLRNAIVWRLLPG